MAKVIKAVPVRNFKDAGAKAHYFAGKEASFSEGQYANFLAAGLLKAPEAPKQPAQQNPDRAGDIAG